MQIENVQVFLEECMSGRQKVTVTKLQNLTNTAEIQQVRAQCD